MGQVAKEVRGPLTPITADIVATAIERNAELLRQEQVPGMRVVSCDLCWRTHHVEVQGRVAQVRRTNAEAKNALEAFIIETRDKMSDNTVEQVCQPLWQSTRWPTAAATEMHQPLRRGEPSDRFRLRPSAIHPHVAQVSGDDEREAIRMRFDQMEEASCS